MKKPKNMPPIPEDTESTITQEQWLMQFTTAMVEEVLSLTNEQVKLYGAEFGHTARLNVIASLVSSMVYKELTYEPKSKLLSLATEECHRAYTQVKSDIQEAVASGFEGAVMAWRGDSPEYYCVVEVEPDNVSMESC